MCQWYFSTEEEVKVTFKLAYVTAVSAVSRKEHLKLKSERFVFFNISNSIYLYPTSNLLKQSTKLINFNESSSHDGLNLG